MIYGKGNKSQNFNLIQFNSIQIESQDKTHMLIGTRLEWDPVLLETIKTEVPKMVAKVTDALVKTWKPVINDILADIEVNE